MNNILYIGLNGYAGSGKDTVAKMMYCILNEDCQNKDEAYELFKTKYSTEVRPYATIDDGYSIDKKCTCIAFADRLKSICSEMFGIPVSYFYYKKANAWVCINKDFEYTETKPDDSHIVDAHGFYVSKSMYMYSTERYYMNLRELLVYVGTYICQMDINPNTFVNSVSNTLYQRLHKNSDISYVICTDVRFIHEYNYIVKNNGIMINIIRDSVSQMENIAEHKLDQLDEESYDFTIKNNGTYKQLFDTVWNLIQNNLVFRNNTIDLYSMDSQVHTYLRLLKDRDDYCLYRVCTPEGISVVSHRDKIYSHNSIVYIEPKGCPKLEIGRYIDGYPLKVVNIVFNTDRDSFEISVAPS